MPYVRCQRCGLLGFSVARWSHVDRCGRCDEELAPPRTAMSTLVEPATPWLPRSEAPKPGRVGVQAGERGST